MQQHDAVSIADQVAREATGKSLAELYTDSGFRDSVIRGVELVLMQDRLARTETDDTEDQRRHLVAALSQHESHRDEEPDLDSQDVTETLRALRETRTHALGEDGDLLLPALVEIAAVAPARIDRHAPQSATSISERADRIGYADAAPYVAGRVVTYIRSEGGSDAADPSDPCPFFGPTHEEIEAAQKAREDRETELLDALKEDYLDLVHILSTASETAEAYDRFDRSNRGLYNQNSSIERITTKLLATESTWYKMFSKAPRDIPEEVQTAHQRVRS